MSAPITRDELALVLDSARPEHRAAAVLALLGELPGGDDQPAAVELPGDVEVGCDCTGEGWHEFRGDGCQHAGTPRPTLTPFSRTSIPGPSMVATGTCPDCSRTGAKVLRRDLHGFDPRAEAKRSPFAPPYRGVYLGFLVEVGPHRTPGRKATGGNQPCATGPGKLPVGFRFTPSPLIAAWIKEYGAETVR